MRVEAVSLAEADAAAAAGAERATAGAASRPYDVFISHRAAHARRVAADLYTSLASLGYRAYVRRLCMENVGEVRGALELCATAVLALT